jgi:hypothetical protein
MIFLFESAQTMELNLFRWAGSAYFLTKLKRYHIKDYPKSILNMTLIKFSPCRTKFEKLSAMELIPL